MSNTNKAALLDSNNKVIGEVFDAPAKGSTIDVAGCFTAGGDPVNIKEYKISRSKSNLNKAAFEQSVSKVGDCYTFHNVVNGVVVY